MAASSTGSDADKARLFELFENEYFMVRHKSKVKMLGFAIGAAVSVLICAFGLSVAGTAAGFRSTLSVDAEGRAITAAKVAEAARDRAVAAAKEAQGLSAIGDIAMSILPPDKFREARGDGWVLLNGSTAYSDELAKLAEAKSPLIPDARGVFLRGMNVGRDQSHGDADGDREVGAPQQDSLQQHRHDMNDKGRTYTTNHTGNNPPQGWGSGPYTETMTATGAVIGGSVSTETRPRNIAVYIYMKNR